MRIGVVAGLDSLGCRGVCLSAGGTAVDRRLRLLANRIRFAVRGTSPLQRLAVVPLLVAHLFRSFIDVRLDASEVVASQVRETGLREILLVRLVEALLTEEFLFLKGVCRSHTLPLLTQVVGIATRGEVDQAVDEFVFRVQVREAVKGRQAAERVLRRGAGEGGREGLMDRKGHGLAAQNHPRLLVIAGERGQRRQLSRGGIDGGLNRQLTGVTEVGAGLLGRQTLRLGNECGDHGRWRWGKGWARAVR